MGNDEVDVALPFAAGATHHLEAERPDAAAGVEDDLLVALGHLDAGRVAAVGRALDEFAPREERIDILGAAGLAVYFQEMPRFLLVLLLGHRRRQRAPASPDRHLHVGTTSPRAAVVPSPNRPSVRRKAIG